MRKITFYIIFLTILTTGSSCKHSKTSCSSVRTGTFIQHAKFNNKIIVIERNDSLQIEKDPYLGTTVTNKIKWVSPCSYILTSMAAPGKTADKTDQFFQSHPLKVNIVEVKKSYYIFTCEVDSADFKTVVIRDTLFTESLSKLDTF